MTGDRASWATTTHRWAADVDLAHLARVRHELGRGRAGGRRHLVLETLACAQDEAEALGRRGQVVVTVADDGSVTVDDDGRGTDTRVDADGTVVRKPVMATPDVRFADPDLSPRLPDGLARRGMSTVAALSRVLVHVNHRETAAWSQTYRFGVPDDVLCQVDDRGRTGTVVTFWCDLPGPAEPTDADLMAFPALDVRLARHHGAPGATPSR